MPGAESVLPGWTSRALLIAGLVGFGAAVLMALGPWRGTAMDRQSIVQINTAVISRSNYAQALAALSADKKSPLTPADKAHVLDRLIDEELLLQRALELGLAQSDGSSRKALVQAAIQFATLEADGKLPDDAELERFYQARPTLFAAPPLVSVKIDAPSGSKKFGPMPSDKLADYVGPDIAARAARLPAGTASAPLVLDGERVTLTVLQRVSPAQPKLADIRPQLQQAWQRDAADRALDSYLKTLRDQARISRAADAPR